MVGMLETPKWPASAVSASTSTFATFTEPSYSAAIWSMTGATCLHGPHHAAQKSTNTGTSEFKTSSSKVSTVTAIGSDILYLLIFPICSLVYFIVKCKELEGGAPRPANVVMGSVVYRKRRERRDSNPRPPA